MICFFFRKSSGEMFVDPDSCPILDGTEVGKMSANYETGWIYVGF